MKIFITGTKGIPNQYGGFEQFAQYLSQHLASRGHAVSIYNPCFHPNREDPFNKVNIIRKFSPEKIVGGAANYYYDFLCIKDAIKNKADIILECGYASAVPAYRLLNFKNSKIITHLDGFEWQRTKWSGTVRRLIRKAEQTAVEKSDALVCDHPLIQQYFKDKYSVKPEYIPFGADQAVNAEKDSLETYKIDQDSYYLVIARLEPENNIHKIIKGFLKAQTSQTLVIIGNSNNSYSRRLKKQYHPKEKVIFLEGIYDNKILNSLRRFSKAYFHGHSVGGTNPSLLEAMAGGAMIIANDNQFNRYILNDNALYFNSEDDIARLLGTENEWINKKTEWVENNKRLISEKYRWEKIADQYEDLFRKVLEKNQILK